MLAKMSIQTSYFYEQVVALAILTQEQQSTNRFFVTWVNFKHV